MSPQRIAVVTGANRGIGFEICRQLARKGLRVILTARDEARASEAAARLRSEGLEAQPRALDVTSAESVRAFVRALREDPGRADVLVNNAGIFIDGETPALQADIDVVRRTLETNLYGPWLLCQQIIPLMLQNGYGRIVNLSSGMGQLSDMNGGHAGYRLSKAGINVMTRVLADELKGTNVLINSVCPGWVRTDMGGKEAPRTVEQGADTPVFLATLPDGGPGGGFFRDRKTIPW